MLRNGLRRLLARRRLRVVAEFGNRIPVQTRRSLARIEADGDQISRVVPRDLLCTVDPFQGRRDRIRSPHSRSAGLRFHHAVHLKRDFGVLVGDGSVGALRTLAAHTAREAQGKCYCVQFAHSRLRHNLIKSTP